MTAAVVTSDAVKAQALALVEELRRTTNELRRVLQDEVDARETDGDETTTKEHDARARRDPRRSPWGDPTG